MLAPDDFNAEAVGKMSVTVTSTVLGVASDPVPVTETGITTLVYESPPVLTVVTGTSPVPGPGTPQAEATNLDGSLPEPVFVGKVQVKDAAATDNEMPVVAVCLDRSGNEIASYDLTLSKEAEGVWWSDLLVIAEIPEFGERPLVEAAHPILHVPVRGSISIRRTSDNVAGKQKLSGLAFTPDVFPRLVEGDEIGEQDTNSDLGIVFSNLDSGFHIQLQREYSDYAPEPNSNAFYSVDLTEEDGEDKVSDINLKRGVNTFIATVKDGDGNEFTRRASLYAHTSDDETTPLVYEGLPETTAAVTTTQVALPNGGYYAANRVAVYWADTAEPGQVAEALATHDCYAVAHSSEYGIGVVASCVEEDAFDLCARLSDSPAVELAYVPGLHNDPRGNAGNIRTELGVPGVAPADSLYEGLQDAFALNVLLNYRASPDHPAEFQPYRSDYDKDGSAGLQGWAVWHPIQENWYDVNALYEDVGIKKEILLDPETGKEKTLFTYDFAKQVSIQPLGATEQAFIWANSNFSLHSDPALAKWAAEYLDKAVTVAEFTTPYGDIVEVVDFCKDPTWTGGLLLLTNVISPANFPGGQKVVKRLDDVGDGFTCSLRKIDLDDLPSGATRRVRAKSGSRVKKLSRKKVEGIGEECMRDATRGRNLTDIGTRNIRNRSGHGFDGVYKYVDGDGVERIVIGEAKGGAGKLGKGIKKADGTYARQMSEEWIEMNAKRMKDRARDLGDEATERLADDIIDAIGDGRLEGRIYRTTIDYATETGQAIIRPTTETIVRY
ncbi:MAG: hypothetical protein ACYTKD_29610, partial [Planctomycetota bacterium]|jgi:hypothetical protein